MPNLRERARAVELQEEGERKGASLAVCGHRGRVRDAAVCPTGNTMLDKTVARAQRTTTAGRQASDVDLRIDSGYW